MQAFPVQVKPVRAKPAQEKPFLEKKPQRQGIWGGIWPGGQSMPTLCERAKTGAFLAVTGAVCGNVAGWVCIQLLARE